MITIHLQVKIFSGSFGGTTLWENPSYVSPSRYRQSLTKKSASRYENRVQQKVDYEASRPETAYPELQSMNMFEGDPMEVAKEEVEGKQTLTVHFLVLVSLPKLVFLCYWTLGTQSKSFVLLFR